jgi:hypothetical protein
MKPEYWDKAKRALARSDPVMAQIIRRHPRVHLVPRGDPFHTSRAPSSASRPRSSGSAAWGTGFDRSRCGVVSLPEGVLSGQRQGRCRGLRVVGPGKCEYIAGPRAAPRRRPQVHVHRWPGMDDEADDRGPGWCAASGAGTAEMFLMFSLPQARRVPARRPGLQKGHAACALHGPCKVLVPHEEPCGAAARPGGRGARWRPGTCGDRSIPVPVEYCGPERGRIASVKTASRNSEQPIAELEGEDRRAALRPATTPRSTSRRRSTALTKQEPGAHQGHLREPDAVAGGAGGAPPAAPVHARLHAD